MYYVGRGSIGQSALSLNSVYVRWFLKSASTKNHSNMEKIGGSKSQEWKEFHHIITEFSMGLFFVAGGF